MIVFYYFNVLKYSSIPLPSDENFSLFSFHSRRSFVCAREAIALYTASSTINHQHSLSFLDYSTYRSLAQLYVCNFSLSFELEERERLGVIFLRFLLSRKWRDKKNIKKIKFLIFIKWENKSSISKNLMCLKFLVLLIQHHIIGIVLLQCQWSHVRACKRGKKNKSNEWKIIEEDDVNERI